MTFRTGLTVSLHRCRARMVSQPKLEDRGEMALRRRSSPVDDMFELVAALSSALGRRNCRLSSRLAGEQTLGREHWDME